MRKFDAIIVGGSCCGAAAGYALTKAGKKALIIDKATFPRDKLCGGLVTEKTIGLLRKIYDDVNLDEIINSSYNSYGIYSKDIGKVSKHSRLAKKLFFVERTIFDDYFLNKTINAGCAILTGQRVVEVDGNQVRVDTGEKFEADIIIGADGANSIIRKRLYPEFNKKLFTMAFEANLRHEDMKCLDDSNGTFPKIYFGYVNYGYGWVFPKKDFVTVGLGGLAHKNNLKKCFYSLLNDVTMVNLKSLPIGIKGFPVPFHNFNKRPANGNLILAGDAAGFVEPITGEGIYFAILSGKLAAESIIEGPDCANNYIKKAGKEIYPILRQAYFMRRFFYHPMGLKYAISKLKSNAKFCKYYFDVVAGEMDYFGYIMTVLKDRNKYKSE